MAGPLSGIVVLDLTQQLVGPGATMLLGDMGAEIVHVEPPPGVQESDPASATADSVGRLRASLNWNRNKQSVCVDLTVPAGRELVLDIARKADVCIQNYRPGVAAKLGLEYENVRAVNPGLVYCEISAFGFEGPDRHRVGFDIIAQGGGGAMVPGWRDPSLPSPLPVPIGDVTGMCLAALGVVSAILHRNRTGEGQRVRTSMLDGVVLQSILKLVSFDDDDREWRDATVQGLKAMAEAGAAYDTIYDAGATGIGGLPTQGTAGIPAGVYYRVYRTADGFVSVGCLNVNQQKRLNKALELGDPRFEPEMDLRSSEALERASRMQPMAEAKFLAQPTDHWISFLDERSIACGRVLNTLELFDYPHHLENQMIIETVDPWVGPVRMVGHPIKFSETPMSVRSPASPAGLDTDSVLRWLGYTPERIAELKDGAVVYASPIASDANARK